jgi:hypothetical protein
MATMQYTSSSSQQHRSADANTVVMLSDVLQAPARPAQRVC